jgi:hypothetical protein
VGIQQYGFVYLKKSYQNLFVYGIEDSENAISNYLETERLHIFKIFHSVPTMVAPRGPPKAKSHGCFFLKVGNYDRVV